MNAKMTSVQVSACWPTAAAFGVLAGLGGITHGLGEVLQGSVPVEGIALDSWTTGPIAEHMGGEPGITVLPTALSAGLVTLVVACSVVAWSIVGLRRRHGGAVLILLSCGMLLAGGGVGPPIIGMLAGAVDGATLTTNRAGPSGCPLACVGVWPVSGLDCSPWRWRTGCSWWSGP